MLNRWMMKRTVKKYLSKLPADLYRRYGFNDYYTFGQVEKTLDELRYPKHYRGYAYAILLNEADALEALGSREIIESLMEEIADLFFHGDRDFKIKMAQQRLVGNDGFCSLRFEDTSD